MSARNVLSVKFVLVRLVCIGRFWSAVAILYFAEGVPYFVPAHGEKTKIWAEGSCSFAAMKREHNFLTIRKRGILVATEECLLSAMH